MVRITYTRPDITEQDHYLNIWQPWEARYEVMMEGCVGEEWRRRWKEWKRIKWEEVCSWLTIGFSLIRWGICRRHTDQPTAYFYDPQSSYASIPRSFNPFLHPPLPCFQSSGRHGWDVVIYTSVHVCASCVWSNEAVPQDTFPILLTHYQPIGIPD